MKTIVFRSSWLKAGSMLRQRYMIKEVNLKNVIIP